MFCDSRDGWWEVAGRFKKGMYVYLWLMHVNVQPKKPARYCKAFILQLERKFKKKHKKIHFVDHTGLYEDKMIYT